jgi:hypothetical protein
MELAKPNTTLGLPQETRVIRNGRRSLLDSVGERHEKGDGNGQAGPHSTGDFLRLYLTLVLLHYRAY